MLQISILYATDFYTICYRFLYYIHQTPKPLKPYNLKAYST